MTPCQIVASSVLLATMVEGRGKRTSSHMKIKCPGCDKVYSLKSELAGKTVKCAACQHKMRVPVEHVKTVAIQKRAKELLDFPFEHARGRISLAEYVIGDHPPSDGIGAIMQAGEHFLDAFPTVYKRVVGKLVVVANRVEAGLIKENA